MIVSSGDCGSEQVGHEVCNPTFDVHECFEVPDADDDTCLYNVYNDDGWHYDETYGDLYDENGEMRWWRVLKLYAAM